MHIPSSLIVLPCLVAFMAFTLKFYVRSANREREPVFRDPYFGLMAITIVFLFAYLFEHVVRSGAVGDPVFLAVALVLMGASIGLFLRKRSG